MGAQWKHAGRVAGANQRSKIIGKLVKEIIVAAKMGDPNPDSNARLRTAIEAAKKQSVPRDTIERAVKKGSGQLDEQINYELVTYEGFAPGQVPVVVECMTENRNRTASEIRMLFRKGQLGQKGAVAWMFDRLGVIEATHADRTIDAETVAIEAGAQNFEPLEAEEVPAGQIGVRFYAEAGDLDAVTHFLRDAKWTVTLSELGYIAKNPVELTEGQKAEVTEFLGAIHDFDDTHRVYAAVK